MQLRLFLKNDKMSALVSSAYSRIPVEKMTEAEEQSTNRARHTNGDVVAELSTVEDVFDDTYKEKEGPKPPRQLVLKNVVLMTFLHIGAMYGLILIPSASTLTLAWCEYKKYIFLDLFTVRHVA